MLDWTPTKKYKIGDHITADLPPPLTWWDRFLWRFFRIERKRPTTRQALVVTDIYPKDDQPQQTIG